MAGSREDLEQRIIEHEALLGRNQAVREWSRAAREERRDQRSATAEARWFREQYVSMLRSAASEQELVDLGLSDELIRDAGLGNSLREAWRNFRPPFR